MQGYDEYLVTERAVPTYDPMKIPVDESEAGKRKKTKKTETASKIENNKKFKWPKWEPGGYWEYIKEGEPYEHSKIHYWKGPEMMEKQNVDGCDSRIIMDRTVDFLERAVKKNKPFFIAVWFHTPHQPLVAGPEALKIYPDCPLGEQAYYGSVTEMDKQIGRLRKTLKTLGVADNTMLWFTSDNGPSSPDKKAGRTGGLRGGKATLWEGGIRVPGLLEWPAKIRKPMRTSVPMVTTDYLPTIMSALGYGVTGYALDGIDMIPLLDGKMKKRPTPIMFSRTVAKVINDNHYKLTLSILI